MISDRTKIRTLLVAAAGDHEATLSLWTRARAGAEWRLERAVRAGWLDRNNQPLNPELRAQRLKEALGGGKKSFKAQYRILVLPRQAVTMRHARLPSSDDGEIAKMARFEAEKQIPFNAERHIVSHHVLEKQGIEGTLTLIGAIDRALLENYLAPFSAAGIYFQEALVSAQALYNLHPATPAEAEHSSMILHIGRGSTDLLLVHQNRLEFSRSLALGGAGLVQQLQRRLPAFELATFAEVDALEPQRYFEAVAQPPAEAAVAGAADETPLQVVQRSLGKLLIEIKRTWDFAQREKPYPPLDRIFISGAAALWKNLDEYLQLNTGCAVLRLAETESSRAIRLNGAEAAEAPLWLPESGAVAQLDHPQPLTLNLLPTDYLQKQLSEKQLRQWTVIGALLLVWLLSGLLLYHKAQSNRQLTYQRYLSLNSDMEKQAQKLLDDENKLGILEKNTNDERSALMILDQLNTFETIPDKITLLYYDFKRNKELMLKGHARTIPDINAFVTELRQSGLFEFVDPINQSPDRLKGRDERIYKFDVLCKFPAVEEQP